MWKSSKETQQWVKEGPVEWRFVILISQQRTEALSAGKLVTYRDLQSYVPG